MSSSSWQHRVPLLALLLACVFWGFSFTWAKEAGEAMNLAAGLPKEASLGAVLVVATRFLIAGAVWFAAVPAARRGWSAISVKRVLILGAILSAAIVTQQTGLMYTSEAVNAFLTNLVIIFVPLIMTLVLRRPPRPMLWVAVALASVGVWRMTGCAPEGFRRGEILSLACAVFYSAQVITVNTVAGRDNPCRMNAGQAVVVGVVCFICCFFLPSGQAPLLKQLPAILGAPGVFRDIALLVIFPTLGAFGLQLVFQPRVDPTRAALIYLTEPFFATAFAYITKDRGLSAVAWQGAGLILVANVLVELLDSRPKPAATAPALEPAATSDDSTDRA